MHTLESHEAEMPNCSDPDCEFHHPEVLDVREPEWQPKAIACQEASGVLAGRWKAAAVRVVWVAGGNPDGTVREKVTCPHRHKHRDTAQACAKKLVVTAAREFRRAERARESAR